MQPKQLMTYFIENPRKLFLVDGIGALLSTFLLGVVLVKFERFFGIPPSTLYFLAALPILFASYDFYCHQKGGARIGVFLKGIAIMNLLYCCISLGFAFYHSDTITVWGWVYILIEILIVTSLAVAELIVARTLTPKIT